MTKCQVVNSWRWLMSPGCECGANRHGHWHASHAPVARLQNEWRSIGYAGDDNYAPMHYGVFTRSSKRPAIHVYFEYIRKGLLTFAGPRKHPIRHARRLCDDSCCPFDYRLRSSDDSCTGREEFSIVNATSRCCFIPWLILATDRWLELQSSLN